MEGMTRTAKTCQDILYPGPHSNRAHPESRALPLINLLGDIRLEYENSKWYVSLILNEHVTIINTLGKGGEIT
jgi:hypothetical protein